MCYAHVSNKFREYKHFELRIFTKENGIKKWVEERGKEGKESEQKLRGIMYLH